MVFVHDVVYLKIVCFVIRRHLAQGSNTQVARDCDHGVIVLQVWIHNPLQ